MIHAGCLSAREIKIGVFLEFAGQPSLISSRFQWDISKKTVVPDIVCMVLLSALGGRCR